MPRTETHLRSAVLALDKRWAARTGDLIGNLRDANLKSRGNVALRLSLSEGEWSAAMLVAGALALARSGRDDAAPAAPTC